MCRFTTTHRSIASGPARLRCQQTGQGRTAVFLASWSLPGASWRSQMRSFAAAGWRCIAYDRRGHGASPDPGGAYDFDTLADDLAAVLAAHAVQDALLVSFSAGAGEAVRYLTRHGAGRIAGLAMIAPTTPLLARRPDNPQGIDPAIFAAFVAEELRPDWHGWLRRNVRPFAGPDVPATVCDWLVELALQAAPHALEAFHHALTTTDFRAALPGLALPTLVLQGEHDASSPPALTGQPTAALIPGARLKIYPGAPHGLIVSHENRLLADLLAFGGRI